MIVFPMSISAVITLLSFALFKDRSKIAGVPARIVRWVSLAILALAPLVAWRFTEDWRTALIAGVAGLVLTVVAMLHAVLLHRYQLRTTEHLYNEWAYQVGAPQVSSLELHEYSDRKRVKADRRTVRSRLKIDWHGRTIRAVSLRGEGGKIEPADVKKFSEYMLTAGRAKPQDLYVFDLTRVRLGELTGQLVQSGTAEASTYELKWKFFELLKNSSLIDVVDPIFPTIELPDYNASTETFTQVLIADLKSGSLDYYLEPFLSLVQHTWPEAGLWRAVSTSPTAIQLQAYERDSVEMVRENHEELVKKLAKSALAQANLFVETRVKDVVVQNNDLSSFTLVFHDDSLQRGDSLRAFLTPFSGLLKQKYPIAWRVSNKLVEDSALIFRAPS